MIAKDAPIVAMAIQGHDLVNRAQEIHHTFPVATAALGRTLLIASMMGEQLKEKDGSVTIRIQGGGPLGTILAVSDSEGNVRGYVQNGQVDLPLKFLQHDFMARNRAAIVASSAPLWISAVSPPADTVAILPLTTGCGPTWTSTSVPDAFAVISYTLRCLV